MPPSAKTGEKATTAVKPKAAAPKKTAPKTAAPKTPAAKTAAPKAAAKPKAAPKAAAQQVPELSPEQRRYYVEVAAYFMAERRGFQGGDPASDWLAAEAEIDRLLREGVLKP